VEPLPLLAQGREAEVFARPDGTVVKVWRRADHGWRADRESAALTTLRAQGHTAPRVLGPATVDGRPGLILERVDGGDLLSALGRRPLAVFGAGRVMGEVHAAMHDCVAPDTLPSLHDQLRPRLEEAADLPDDLREAALGLLDGLPPGDRLCHGDLHLGNVLGSWTAPMVIDWADAARGDPVGDVANTVVLHRVGEPPPGSPQVVRSLASLGRRVLRDRYLATYRGRRAVDPGLLARWEFVRAAARVWAPVPNEYPALLRLLRAPHQVFHA
jgi:aminoglycoside phosphotransferase (APT) family kinase protein